MTSFFFIRFLLSHYFSWNYRHSRDNLTECTVQMKLIRGLWWNVVWALITGLCQLVWHGVTWVHFSGLITIPCSLLFVCLLLDCFFSLHIPPTITIMQGIMLSMHACVSITITRVLFYCQYQLAYALCHRSHDGSIDWLIAWLMDQSIDGLIAWLMDWTIDGSIDWSFDWLIGRLILLILRRLRWVFQGSIHVTLSVTHAWLNNFSSRPFELFSMIWNVIFV